MNVYSKLYIGFRIYLIAGVITLKKTFLVGLGLFISLPALANEQQTTDQAIFLETQGSTATSIAKGVYEIRGEDGAVTRHAFGTDGAKYDLQQAKNQLTTLTIKGAQRALNEEEINVAATLRSRIIQLEELISAGHSGISADAYGGTVCGSGGFLFEVSPSTSVGHAGAAIATKSHDGFAPPPPNTLHYTLDANVVIYSDSSEATILGSETAPTVITDGPAAGRATAFAGVSASTCYGVSTATVSTNKCASPNNYASLTSSSSCN